MAVEAQDQQALLTQEDIAKILDTDVRTIRRDIQQLRQRGTIHDMGRSVTHKQQICYKMIVEGKTVEQTARETNHSPEAITRYVKDYKRILACLHKGLTPKETSFVAKVSETLVFDSETFLQKRNGCQNQERAGLKIA